MRDGSKCCRSCRTATIRPAICAIIAAPAAGGAPLTAMPRPNEKKKGKFGHREQRRRLTPGQAREKQKRRGSQRHRWKQLAPGGARRGEVCVCVYAGLGVFWFVFGGRERERESPKDFKRGTLKKREVQLNPPPPAPQFFLKAAPRGRGSNGGRAGKGSEKE